MDDEYDYDYDADCNDQENEEGEEADIEATIEVDCYDAEEFIRKGNYDDGIKAFQNIYETADANNLRNWKIKAITQLLQIHIQLQRYEEVRENLKTISQINQLEKISETTVKSIVITLQGMDSKIYDEMIDVISPLIGSMDPSIQLKSYTMMMEKELSEKNTNNALQIFKKIQQITSTTQITVGAQIEIFSLELKLMNLQGRRNNQKLKKMKLKLPMLEDETSINDTHLSEIKENIAALLYEEENYRECSKYLCDCFLENAQFGKNSENLKTMLKVNILVLLLCNDVELVENRAYNPLKSDSASTFKMETDVQALYGLIEAFNTLNIKSFEEILGVVNLSSLRESPYADIERRVILEAKKNKISFIIAPYKTIRFEYLQRRIKEDVEIIRDMLFSLITDRKVNGVIHLEGQYLEILPPAQRYYEMQIQNLRDLQERM